MDIVSQGLQFSVIGLISIFLFMFLFWGIMALLPKIFPDKEEGEDTGKDEPVVQAVVETESSEDEEIVAAIAAALAYLRTTGESKLGARLEEGRGAWWLSKQMAARQNSAGDK